MSLRRSPRLTRAALSARRANALKSTGPRTERGQRRVRLNSLLHGDRSRLGTMLAQQPLAQQLEFAHIYAALHKALVPGRQELGLVLRLASGVWWLKRTGERVAQHPDFRAEMQAGRGWMPPPLRTRIPWRDGRLVVTASLRRGRGRTGLLRGRRDWSGYGPMHAELKIYLVRPGRRWQRLAVQGLARLLGGVAAHRKESRRAKLESFVKSAASGDTCPPTAPPGGGAANP